VVIDLFGQFGQFGTGGGGVGGVSIGENCFIISFLGNCIFYCIYGGITAVP